MFLSQQQLTYQNGGSTKPGETTLAFSKLRTIHELSLEEKTVILRVDLDVLPLTTDEPASRLVNIKKTVDYIFNQGGKRVILIGHAGRPKIKDRTLSTKQLIIPLQNILKRNITFSDNFGDIPEERLILFENIRFWPEETEKFDSNTRLTFAKMIADMGDIYINDAFGNCHRDHTSMVEVAKILPSAIGLQIEKEIKVFEKVFQRQKKGFVTIIGGAKIETKLPVITMMAPLSEYVLVGGVLPKEIKEKEIAFPENVIVAGIKNDIPDIDEESSRKFTQIIRNAQTIIWNGPMGVFEEKVSSKGTDAVAQAIIHTAKTNSAFSVAGGGETEKYLRREKQLDTFTHVSNGGGALLHFLSGKELFALTPLKSNNN